MKLPAHCRIGVMPEGRRYETPGKEHIMLWTLVVILIILWALGLVTSYTLGGLIHILLVVAIIVVLFNVIQGRRT